MEPRREMPMTSTVVLLVYFIIGNVLNDPDGIVYRTWQTKMVSATFSLRSQKFCRSVRGNYIRGMRARAEEQSQRERQHKEL